MPRGSSFRERVQFQAHAATTNIGGVKKATSWSDVGDPVSAQIVPLQRGEQVLGGRLAGRAVYEIRVRGSAFVRTLTSAHRIIDVRRPTRVFNITGDPINPDQVGAYYHFLCETVGAVAQ